MQGCTQSGHGLLRRSMQGVYSEACWIQCVRSEVHRIRCCATTCAFLAWTCWSRCSVACSSERRVAVCPCNSTTWRFKRSRACWASSQTIRKRATSCRCKAFCFSKASVLMVSIRGLEIVRRMLDVHYLQASGWDHQQVFVKWTLQAGEFLFLLHVHLELLPESLFGSDPSIFVTLERC